MKPMTIIWVVERDYGDGWWHYAAKENRADARELAAYCRKRLGGKARIVRFIRESA